LNQILNAYSALKSNHILHRNIKYENILLTNDNTNFIKLDIFGDKLNNYLLEYTTKRVGNFSYIPLE